MTYKKITAVLCALALTGMAGFFSVQAAAPAADDPIFHIEKSDSQRSQAVDGSIKSVTSIATVFGDGEKVDAVALEYPKRIDASSLSPADFTVEGQEIVSAYTNDQPAQGEEPGSVAVPGKYVILKLKYVNEQEEKLLAQQQKSQDKGKEIKNGDAPHFSDRSLPDLSVTVRQTGFIRSEDGYVYGPSEAAVVTTRTTENDLSGFKQYTYMDPVTGYTIPYNLFLQMVTRKIKNIR